MIRAVLQSSKNGVAMSSLQAEYRALSGETIPLKRLGFNNLEDYLRSIPSVVRLECRLGSLVCFAAVCKETIHIAELVARQKNAKKSGRSQLVNCRMRFKPSDPFTLSVKPKTSLRQPTNWTNRRPAHGYGAISATGDVRQFYRQSTSFVPVQQRPPSIPQTITSNRTLDIKLPGSQVNHQPPGKLIPPKGKAEPPVQTSTHPIDFNLKLEQTRLGQVLSVYSSGLWMSKLQAVYNKMFNQQPHPKTLIELEKWTDICSLEKLSMMNRADRLIYPALPTKPPTTYRNSNDSSVSPLSPVSTPGSSRPSTPEELLVTLPASVPKARGPPRSPLAKPTFVFQPNAQGDYLRSSSSRAVNPLLSSNLVNVGCGDAPSFPSTTGDEIPQSELAPARTAPGPDVVSLLKAKFQTNSDLPLEKRNASSTVINLDVRQKVKELLVRYSSGLWFHALPKLFEDTFKTPLPENAFDDWSLWLDICNVEYPIPNNKKKAILYYSCRDELETTEEETHPLPSGLEILGSVVPPRLALPPEQYPSVLITDAKGSSAVTVRFVGKNYSTAQEAMEDEMRSFYTGRSSSSCLRKVCIGQLVAVKDKGEDDVTRGQVMEVLSPHKIKVYYLDYGCSVEISSNNLFELHENFLLLPFQAMDVKLAGLEHFSSHSSMLSILEKLAVGKILLMETLEPNKHSDIPVVVLYDTSQDEDLNINLACLKELQDETMNNPLLINGMYQDVCVTNVCPNGSLFCQLPSRGMARLGKLLEETEAFFKSQVTSELLVSRPYSGKLCLACYKGKWSRVEVISIYGNRVVEILLIDNGVTMTIELTELREIPPPFFKDLVIIPPQAVRCCLEGVQVPEGGWSLEAVNCVKGAVFGFEITKLKILSLGEQRGISVHLFVDTDSLEVEDSVNHQLAQSELWKKLVAKHISNSSTDKGLSALVKRLSLKNVLPTVNLSQTAKNGLEILTSQTCAESTSLPPLLDLPQPGQNMDVFVPVACHPGYFVLQPWQDLHKLTVLMGEMVLYYNKTAKDSHTEIKNGEIYAAQIDKNWHRVHVKGILSNGLVSVFELDHGKHELVRSSDIQPLIEEFRHLPFQAITAQLAGLTEFRSWSEEASMVFRNHVEKRALVAQLDSVEEAPDGRSAPWERKVTVYLVDTSDDGDLWIHSIMSDMSSAA